MELPDGTILMHGSRPYDPAKAREYYLRTRKLKGRRPAKGFDTGTSKVGVGSSIKKPIPAKKSKVQTRKQQMAEIRDKLDQLRQLGKGKSDIAARTASEKTAASKAAQAKLKKDREAISEEIHSVRKDVASLNETLKAKIRSNAPSSEIESVRTSLEAKKGELEAAAEKLRNLGKATTSG